MGGLKYAAINDGACNTDGDNRDDTLDDDDNHGDKPGRGVQLLCGVAWHQ